MTSLTDLRRVVEEMREEAENISPMDGHSKGKAGNAPALRNWAKRIEKAEAENATYRGKLAIMTGVAGGALSGTNEAEAIAAKHSSPFGASMEALRIRRARGDETLAAMQAPLRADLARAHALLREAVKAFEETGHYPDDNAANVCGVCATTKRIHAELAAGETGT